MSDAEDDVLPAAEAPRAPRGRWRARALWLVAVFALLGLGLWLARDRIADAIVQRQLSSMGLPAKYEIDSVGPDHQVLLNVVIGNPAHPDFTAERVELSDNFGTITLDRPRLYGSYRKGKLSFGTLDKLLFSESKEPVRLPAFFLILNDGRALIESEHGDIGIKAEGRGALRGGFAGTLAATAPKLRLAGCQAEGATLYGKVTVESEKPGFKGPLRLTQLDCPDRKIAIGKAGIAIEAKVGKAHDSVTARVGVSTGALTWGGIRMASLDGSVDLASGGGELSAVYDLAGGGIAASQFAAARIHTKGTLAAKDRFNRFESEGVVDGTGIRPGPGLDAALISAQRSAQGSFAAPMLGQIRAALAREGRSSRLAANYVACQTGKVTNLIVPRAQLSGSSGAPLLALSRVQYTAGQSLAPLVSGNFVTGGAGLPQLSGRMEPRGAGLALRMTMAEYRGGGGRIALPVLELAQARNGALGIAGRATLSEPLPGGSVEGLSLPLDGTWTPGRGLAMWRGCVPLQFRSLSYAQLRLERRALTLCAGSAGSILASDARGTRLAAGASSLDLAGRLGGSPIRIATGTVGLSMPGSLSASDIDVTIGQAGEAARFRLAGLSAKFGSMLAGRFEKTDFKLDAVPLDVFAARGAWQYDRGKLSLSEGAFRLEDREKVDRFNPLVARDATLALEDGRIVAHAALREPRSDREIALADIVHDLDKGVGWADLAAPAVVFDDWLQPERISPLTLGIVANARGTLSGTGRIDWNPGAVTSSGRFSTKGLDFAALFGPVKGVSGEVVFTDLLGLVSAPDQKLKIASINPGIEATDGVMSLELRPEHVLAINGATWPFMDGSLRLKPTQMVLGADETRRFTLEVEGIDAALFVQRLELSNISASGKFDGALPLVFDENGGRIEQGILLSRAPGGNIAYIGELSYQDLSAMGNFAFDALKSLDYKEMRIDLDGSLSDEIVTRVAFEGLSQGAAARQNFLTKQVARLPIKFRVNIRAPFFSLFSSFKSLYDPSAITDPRKLGLLDKKSDEPGVQPSVSEKKP